MDREVWSSFSFDPRDPQVAPMRASDHDRELVQQVLAEAYGDGRLDRAEYDDRSERATGVRTLAEVGPLLADLVAPVPVGARGLVHASRDELERLATRAWERKRRDAAYSFLGVSLVTTGIWLATSFGHDGFDPYFFWPAFVIAASLFSLLRTAGSRRDIVEGEVRRLERQQEKDRRRSRRY